MSSTEKQMNLFVFSEAHNVASQKVSAKSYGGQWTKEPKMTPRPQIRKENNEVRKESKVLLETFSWGEEGWRT